jgi:hypothetical protein
MQTTDLPARPDTYVAPPTPPAPKSHKLRWIILGGLGMFIILAIIGTVLGLADQGTSTVAPAAPSAVIEAPEPTVPVVPAPVEPVEEVEEPVGVQASNGDARACELLELAATREPNSNSWITVVSDANWRATDLDLMDMIDTAYWTSGNALAAERIDLALGRCATLLGTVSS